MFNKIAKGKIWIFIFTSIVLVSLVILPFASIKNTNTKTYETPTPQNIANTDEDLLLTGVLPTYYENEGVNLIIGYSGSISEDYKWKVEDDNDIIIIEKSISSDDMSYKPAGNYNDSNENEIMLNMGSDINLIVGNEYMFSISNVNNTIEQSMSFSYFENIVEFYSIPTIVEETPTSISIDINFTQPAQYTFNKASTMHIQLYNKETSTLVKEDDVNIPTNIISGNINFVFEDLEPETEYTIKMQFENSDSPGAMVGREMIINARTESRYLNFNAYFSNIEVGYESFSATFEWSGNETNGNNLQVNKVSAILMSPDNGEILSIHFGVKEVSSGEIDFTIKNSELDSENKKEIIVDIDNNIIVDITNGSVLQYGLSYYWDFKVDFDSPEDENANIDFIEEEYSFNLQTKKYNYQSNITHNVPKNNVGDDLEQMSSTYHWSGSYNDKDSLVIGQIDLTLVDITDPGNTIDKTTETVEILSDTSGEQIIKWDDDLIEEGHTYRVVENITFKEDPAAEYQINNVIEIVFNDDNMEYIGKNKPILFNYIENISGGSYNLNLVFVNTSSILNNSELKDISIEVLFKDENNELINDQIILSDGTILSDGKIILDYNYIKDNVQTYDFGDEGIQELVDNPGETLYIPFSFTGVPQGEDIIIETNVLLNNRILISNEIPTILNFNYDNSYSINPNSLKLESRYEEAGLTYYEVSIDIKNNNNVNVDLGKDAFIAVNNNGKIEYKDGIDVLGKKEYEKTKVSFGDYNEERLYLKVDNEKNNTSKNNDIDFLMNMYIGISTDPKVQSRDSIPKEELINSSIFHITNIYSFPWWALITPFILLFILIVVLIFIWLWYSNKERRYLILYPVALRAHENWMTQVISYNWNPKVEDFLMLSEMNKKDLDKYAKEKNIPVPNELNHEEKIDFISLLNESELEKVKEFIEYEFFIKEENADYSRKQFIDSSGTEEWTKRMLQRIILQEQIDNNDLTFDGIGLIIKTEYSIQLNINKLIVKYNDWKKEKKVLKFKDEKRGDSDE